MIAVEFFRLVWARLGLYVIETGPHPVKGAPGRTTHWQRAFGNMEDAAAYCMKMCGEFTVYFAVHTFARYHQEQSASGRKWDKVARTQANAAYARALYLDLDVQDPAKPRDPGKHAEQADALADLIAFTKAVGLPRPLVVSSGRGLHVYWPFAEDVPSSEWQPVADLLKRLVAALGLKTDELVTADAARILRPVGTFNRKDPANPLRVEVWGKAATPMPFSALAAIITAAGAGLPPSSRLIVPLVPSASPGTVAPPPEMPENVEKVRNMLAVLSPDVGREEWRNLVWGVASLGWSRGRELACTWSAQSATKFDEGEFATVWDGFDPDRQNLRTWRTLQFLAIAAGYVGPNLTEAGVPAAAPAQGEISIEAGCGAGDIANGRRFAAEARGSLLYLHDTGAFLGFDPARGWASLPFIGVEALAKGVVRTMAVEAAETWRADPEGTEPRRLRQNVERLNKLPHLRAMIELAKSEPGMSASLADFDADPWLLGVQNGVVDLRTGVLRKATPDLRVSKRCRVAFEPDADCPRFRAFLAEVLPDPQVQAFALRFMGYCLTGSVEEQVFLFLHGGGFNGKSVLVDLLAWMLGDYARKIPTEMLMLQQRSAQGPSPDVLMLKGLRLAYASETEDGRRLSEARVKDMTGGECLTARAPYAQVAVDFEPTHKLVISGNHKPAIPDTSHGMWRRVILVLFGVQIPEADRDPDLPAKLRAEGSGILNLALAGLRDWRTGRGLRVPATIQRATAAYRTEQDVLGEFIADECEVGQDYKLEKDALSEAYGHWCEANRHKPMGTNRLTRDLGERGFSRDAGRRFILGLKLQRPGFGRQ